jgi:hypothetical protein
VTNEEKTLTINGDSKFPYLDMQMGWNDENAMCFGLYTKPHYQAKYLNAKSLHPQTCKDAIPHGTAIRIAGLTTRTTENANTSLSDIAPPVDAALKTAGLLLPESKLPTLGKILDNREREIADAQRARQERTKDRRSVYLITKYSGHWRSRPIQETIKRLKKKYSGLGWIRTRIVHKRHNNLKEMLLGDLQSKLMRTVADGSFTLTKAGLPKGCTCQIKVNGKCMFDKECNESSLIYKFACKCCGDYYLGKTSQTLRKRTGRHVTDVGLFWKRMKEFELRNGILSETMEERHPLSEAVELIDDDISLQSTATSVTTRSMSRRLGNTQQPRASPGYSTTSGFNELLDIFNQPPTQSTIRMSPLTVPPTINEEEPADDSSVLSDDASTNTPTPAEPPPPEDPTGHESDAVASTFSQAFNSSMTRQEILQARKGYAIDYREGLDHALSSVGKTSNFTKHMWTHAKEQTFETKGELHQWVRNNMEVSIAWKMNPISHMKTAATTQQPG